MRILVPATWWKSIGLLLAFGMFSLFLHTISATSNPTTPASERDSSRLTKSGRQPHQSHRSTINTKPAEAALATGNASDKEYAMRRLLPELMSQDIAAAGKMAANLKPWAWREEVLFQVAREWATQDPTAAASWAQQLTDAAERSHVFTHVCIEVSKTDPVQALDLAEHQQPLQEQILQILATTDPDAAIRWAGKLTDINTRQTAFAKIALGYAEISPEEAASLVAERLSSGPLQDETALAVLHKWILRNPDEARSWVNIFPDGPLLKTAESELAAAAAYPASQ